LLLNGVEHRRDVDLVEGFAKVKHIPSVDLFTRWTVGNTGVRSITL
jgi:hypothetical protein